MLDLGFGYAQCVASSERISWRVDDVMPADARLDLTRPLLPHALGARGDLSSLSERERLVLNHLASNAYLNLFQFVEEFILCTVVEHAQAELFGDHDNIRALVRFADEEIKHQQLFKRFRVAFDRDFGTPHKVLENAAQVAEIVLSKSPIGVMLVILHIELMTQDHYTQSVRDDGTIDPFFQQLLEKHWLEESQHARIDALELDKLVSAATPAQIAQGFRDYVDLLGAFDGLLESQAKMDLETFETAIGRTLDDGARAALVSAQHAGYRRTFLVAGLRNHQFVRWTRQMREDDAELTGLADRWSA
jgi:hypothetical protein